MANIINKMQLIVIGPGGELRHAKVLATKVSNFAEDLENRGYKVINTGFNEPLQLINGKWCGIHKVKNKP